MKYPRILFFIGDTSPTLEEQVAAEQLAPCRVAFRNATHIGNGALEACDGWFGDAAPKSYRDAFPPAEKAIEAFVEKRDTDFKAKAQKAEVAKQDAVDRVADEAYKVAKKADEEAVEAAKKARGANKDAKTKKTAAKDAKDAARDAKDADPNAAAPTVEAAAKAAGAWTSNA